MGAVDTTNTFTATDVITSTKMNNIIDQTVMTSDAITLNGTLQVVAPGKLQVAAGGITSNELANDAVTTAAITDANVIPAKLANADFGDFTVASGVATLDNDVVTTAKIFDSNVTTAKIADANVTAAKLDGAQTGTAPIYGVRAWAKLNPYVGAIRTGAYKTGNYSRTLTETTVTIVGHGLKTNDKIRLNFTSGSGTDGLYTVTSSANANEFVVNHTGSVTTGNVEAQFVAIQESGNVSTASWYDSGDGRIVLNFTTQMPNNNYATLVTGQHYPSAWISVAGEDTLGTTQLNTIYQGHVFDEQEARFLNVLFVG